MAHGRRHTSAAGPQAVAEEMFGDEALAIQAPMHVGTNNFGFRAGVPISNLDVRPPHVDTIANVYGVDEAPDYFLLCARVTSSDGGGASYLTDIPASVRRMAEPHRSRLLDLEIVQTIKLIAGFDELAKNHTNATQGKVEGMGASRVIQRTEKMVLPNARAPEHACHRYSSWADSLLDDDGAAADDTDAPIRPAPRSANPRLDMQTVAAYLRAVNAETAEAARFLLQPGDCAVIDNYRAAHGREPYGDLGRALWQVWVWSNTSLAVPDNPGPSRRWVRHPRAPTTSDERGEAPPSTCTAEAATPPTPPTPPTPHESGTLRPPTVDFAPFMADEGVTIGEPPTRAQAEAARAIHASYRDHGFLHLTDFGLTPQLLRSAFDTSARLFSLPTDVKMNELPRISPGTNLGYAPLASGEGQPLEACGLRARCSTCATRRSTRTTLAARPTGPMPSRSRCGAWWRRRRAASPSRSRSPLVSRPTTLRAASSGWTSARAAQPLPPPPNGPSRPQEPGAMRIGSTPTLPPSRFCCSSHRAARWVCR